MTAEGDRQRDTVNLLEKRFSAIRSLPRAELLLDDGLGTPIERSAAADALWIKRDDLSAPRLGGNKVRALEYLLGAVAPGHSVLTVGGWGSTHALGTVVHAHRLGARAAVIRWPQEMNDAAHAVAARLRAESDELHDSSTVATAYLQAGFRRLRRRAGGAPLHWVPAGGTNPLGMLGHVNAGLELVAQIERGLLPPPTRVVLPLGTGGTAAGLALGFAIGGLETTVVGVRVVPRIVARRSRVLSLADRTARFIERRCRERGDARAVPRPSPRSVRVASSYYGGAYGRETGAGRAAAARFAQTHVPGALDATYSAKAFAAALALSDGLPTLFWLTFDGRWMGEDSLTV